jgi:hypothetical protein
MKPPIKAAMAGIAACSLPALASAYTISGVIPPGKSPLVIKLHQPIKPGYLKLTFTAPKKNAHVPYALDFCIGPVENPCGLPDDRVVNVPEGQTKSETVDAAIFAANVLVVGQGTAVALPYTVQVSSVARPPE